MKRRHEMPSLQQLYIGRSLPFRVGAALWWMMSIALVATLHILFGEHDPLGASYAFCGSLLLFGLLFHLPYYVLFLFRHYKKSTAIIRLLISMTSLTLWVPLVRQMYVVAEVPYTMLMFFTFVYGVYCCLEAFPCVRRFYFSCLPFFRPQKWREDKSDK